MKVAFTSRLSFTGLAADGLTEGLLMKSLGERSYCGQKDTPSIHNAQPLPSHLFALPSKIRTAAAVFAIKTTGSHDSIMSG
jgi:hypothetical protein